MTDEALRLERLQLPRDRELLEKFHDLYDREYEFRRSEEDRRGFVEYLERHQDIYHCLVFYAGEEPAGYIRGYERISTSSCDIVFMLDIVYVAPDMRSKGIGKKMIGALVEHCRNIGAARIDLLADLGNEVAQKLYESFGFRGRTRFQMHRFLKDHPDLDNYFKKKVEEEKDLPQRTPLPPQGNA